MSSPKTNPRVRIAPSPTGHLHVGTARTALYNYLYAKRYNGTFVMRLEDTDEERSKEEYTQDIIDGLKWLGLSWDEGPDIGGPYPPYKQTQKIDHYQHFANELISKKAAYLCFATQEELAVLKDEQKEAGEAPRYDNRGRDLTDAARQKYEQEGRIPSIRFQVEEPRIVSWNDRIKGEIAIDTADIGGDMVIVKSSGTAIYNFAVVIDDIDMKMDVVIRGEDHIHNTAKQLLIYEALDREPPVFAHCPLIFDLERQKLSKRKHGETVHIDYYRKQGYMPEAIINYLGQMSWTHPENKEIYSLEEAAQVFDLDKVSKSPAVFDVARLNWFNGHYMRSLPLSLVTERALPYLSDYDLKAYSEVEIEEIVGILREGLTTLSEITEAAKFFFDKKVEIAAEEKAEVLDKESAPQVLKKLLETLPAMPWPSASDGASEITSASEKEKATALKKSVDAMGKEISLKGKDLYWPIRVALSGKTHGPDLGTTLKILGEKRVRERLEAALKGSSC